MSGASDSTNLSTTKAVTDDAAHAPSAAAQGAAKKPAPLEEDDEFEDFPVDGARCRSHFRGETDADGAGADWADEDTEAKAQGEAGQHLWEESWDDDDQSEDFAKMLKEELKKVDGGKK